MRGYILVTQHTVEILFNCKERKQQAHRYPFFGFFGKNPAHSIPYFFLIPPHRQIPKASYCFWPYGTFNTLSAEMSRESFRHSQHHILMFMKIKPKSTYSPTQFNKRKAFLNSNSPRASNVGFNSISSSSLVPIKCELLPACPKTGERVPAAEPVVAKISE